MRTVVKSVIRSLSASATSTGNTMNRIEPQNIVGILENRKRNQSSESHIGIFHESHNLNKEYKSYSLSPSYKLSPIEEQSLEYLLDRECDYYPDISNRGDQSILDINCPNLKSNMFNVDASYIKKTLKTIRFVNNFVFNSNSIVFLSASNYLQRLLDKKAVKKDLMPFITAAVYDIAMEEKCGKALNEDQIALLLHLSGIPTNHIEDFNRMKLLLLVKLNQDLQTIIITDYLKLFLRFNFGVNESIELNDIYKQIIDISTVMATSCELTHFTLSCQAFSLISIAARHVVFNDNFKLIYSKTIDKFPIIFLSPVRLTQFIESANITEESIKHCTESIIRYYNKYYLKSEFVDRTTKTNKKDIKINELPTIIEVSETDLISVGSTRLNMEELMEKLNRVSDEANFLHLNGKQRQNRKRIKKKLCRQLRKCRKFQLDIKHKSANAVDDDDDSAFSSSSNKTSVSVSPITY